jgi:hypothetical protein
MLRQLFYTAALPLVWLTLLCGPARGADVLQKLPEDALGFVVVRNAGSTDDRVQKLGEALRLYGAGPLSFLRDATGIDDGLDDQGDFLVAALPGRDSNGRLELCVWLPVSDYNRLLASLGGQSVQGIGVVTVAGEDLLFAQHDKWALVMDPDQRDRMERILAGSADPPSAVSIWDKWVDECDVAAVAFDSGVKEIYAAVSAGETGVPSGAGEGEQVEDLFGPASGAQFTPPDLEVNAGAVGIVAQLRRQVRALRTAVPELTQATTRLQSLGIGLHADGDQNALVHVRAIWEGRGATQQPARHAAANQSPLKLYRDGDFILQAAATLPPAMTSAITAAYLRLQVNQLKSQEQIQLDETTLMRFYEAVGQAAAQATAASILTVPGEKQDGVYTNSFLAVQVDSADKLVDLVSEAMRLWNQMNRDARGGPRLVFDVEESTIGDPPRRAIQYSLDLAAADGTPMLPETRQAMEKLFGPGGKLRLFVARVNDQTVLLAGATQEQVAAILPNLDRNDRPDWQQPAFADAQQLLPERADGRAFFSPHGYTTWKARETAAIVGTEVIGGPLVKEFPAAPPVGLAGGLSDGEAWLDIAVPAATIRGAGSYLQPKRPRR